MINCLFEDKHIAVCIKPAGIQSQSSPDGEDMLSLLNSHFAASGESAQAYPVHRLDKETCGIMVFAKTSASAAKLSKQIADGALTKRYYAVLSAIPDEKNGILKDLLFRDKQKNKSFVVKKMRKGVREASLEYNTVCNANGFALADILLHTGSTHQIRVQFASRKMPLYGDSRYGGPKGKLALFAYNLEFSHPETGEKLSFRAEPDKSEYPWNLFQNF